VKEKGTFQHIVDKHVKKYNERYAEFGDHNKALGWPSKADNQTRFAVMLGIMERPSTVSPSTLLDFGCGLGHLVPWSGPMKYTGLDINPTFVEFCQKKYPDKSFLSLNILRTPDFTQLPTFDYIIANGVFTEKLDTPWHQQWDYFTSILQRLWQRTKHGLAFNVMSPMVDEERTDLFHVPFERIAGFIRAYLGSRKFTFRHDYGLWEYTVYVYR
jgi:2-polyprenyl-3-methyl-5-hydroxy-6-metoxy-1,4-benzoquinol methylase